MGNTKAESNPAAETEPVRVMVADATSASGRNAGCVLPPFADKTDGIETRPPCPARQLEMHSAWMRDHNSFLPLTDRYGAVPMRPAGRQRGAA